MVRRKPTLLFVSPQFLFPMDAGGKIRSANILKRLKGGAFQTRLVMPACEDEESRWRGEIETLADELSIWRPSPQGPLRRWRRAAAHFSQTPISAVEESGRRARKAVEGALAQGCDLVVFDYVQSLAAAPSTIGAPHLFFAHNVETEILERHAALASGAMRGVWAREAAKMRRFEARAAAAADAVIAVSARDAETFRRDFGARAAFPIPTGVDADHFSFAPPDEAAPPEIVFTGSLDWKANEDGLLWFLREAWPLVAAARADARVTIVGRNPPASLVEAARGAGWRFTGFVDDIRDHARGSVFIIPLRVGGGTRIKAFEAMAMGVPVVSTALGVEGLDVEPGEHFLMADDPRAFAEAILRLIDDRALSRRIAGSARRLVEENFSHQAAANAFEQICLEVLDAAR